MACCPLQQPQVVACTPSARPPVTVATLLPTGAELADREASMMMERRGSRARRSASMTLPLLGSGLVEEGQQSPVIDTTSVAVLREADGSVVKVNEYLVLRDLSQSSSADVKLCRLILSAGAGGLGTAGHDNDRGTHGDDVPAHEQDLTMSEAEDGSDLYAIKVFDRAKLMRRGANFSRPRERGPDGALLAGEQFPGHFAKVQREIAIMKKLSHPNVVELVEVIDAPLASSIYMVMEYVEQGPVMSCIDPDKGIYASPRTGDCLDALTSARYFADVLAGVEFLHLHHIAHRDLKPENVLIGNDDRAKIADFGVSHYFNADEPRSPKSARSLARSTSRAQVANAEGTWCFWAPEMCGAGEDEASFNAFAADAWAAGVTLWCFVYGRVPFFSLNPLDLFSAIISDAAPVPDTASEDFRSLVDGILQKDPRLRLSVPEARTHAWVQSLSRKDTVDSAGGAPRASSPSCGCSGDSARAPGYCSREVVGVGHKVSVSEGEVEAAITEAPGLVVVRTLKGTMHEIRRTAKRLSRNLEAAAASALRSNADAMKTRDKGGDDEANRESQARHRRRFPKVHCVAS